MLPRLLRHSLKVLIVITAPVLVLFIAFADGDILRGLAPSPRLIAPTEVAVSEAEHGTMIVALFTLRNSGSAPLTIDGIRSSCACMGLERIDGDQTYRVESLTLAPEEKAQVGVRIRVQGDAGGPMRNLLWFRTNDPNSPEAAISVVISRVIATISLSPTSIVCGELLAGSKRRYVADVFTHANVRPGDIQASARGQSLVSVLGVTAPRDEQQPSIPAASLAHLGTRIGRLEIEVSAPADGEFRETVQITSTSHPGKSFALAVCGTVVKPIELRPAHVLLPRRTAGGDQYATTCICRNRTGGILQLKTIVVPSGWSVSFDENPMPGDRRLTVRCDPAVARENQGGGLIELEAQSEGQRHPLKLPVALHKEVDG
jgi:hypothetical protein